MSAAPKSSPAKSSVSSRTNTPKKSHAASTPPKEFRYIPEGKGGTFTYDITSEDPQQHNAYIGTLDNVTCVSVYWPVDEKRGFLAHINASLTVRSTNVGSWEPSETQGRHIAENVREMLEGESARSGWTNTKDAMKEGFVMVCPEPRNVETGAPQVGWFVIQAVRQWLGFQDLVPENHAGFVVAMPHGKPEYVASCELTDDEQGPAADGWALQEEKGDHVCEWCISMWK